MLIDDNGDYADLIDCCPVCGEHFRYGQIHECSKRLREALGDTNA